MLARKVFSIVSPFYEKFFLHVCAVQKLRAKGHAEILFFTYPRFSCVSVDDTE